MLTLRKVEKLSWIPRNTYNNIENGNVVPHFDTVKQLAKFYWIDPHRFYINLEKEVDKFVEKQIWSRVEDWKKQLQLSLF